MEFRRLLNERQLINARPTTTTLDTPHCTPFTLPSNGVLNLAASSVLTLTADALFSPECTASPDIIVTNAGVPTTISDLRDPFFASTLPQCYALAATTVISYMLVIMLLITPRTFLHEGAVVLGRRGFTNGPSGSAAGIGIGGRPWLQKVAALTVAISLTIATADTFKVAEAQYESGYMNAYLLQTQVENGMELKVIRVISDTFLWLAQAQTLIRLFPRQREKIIIKWTAFALITLDVLFTILNNFVYQGAVRPHNFVDAIPALSYLFQLALSLLYSAWVIYYAISKKQYAFYHSQMRNQCLVALLSLVAVLVPVVFFVLDISKPNLASWGDYVRWVGAAAASVVVWEWVERIEALERNDKKDGVLGREIFDGDEMLDVTPSSDSAWTSGRKGSSKGGGGITSGIGISWPAVAGIANRYRPHADQDVEAGGGREDGRRPKRNLHPTVWLARPPPAATPISRTDTASAESTVYAIRYHPVSEATPPVLGTAGPEGVSRSNSTATSSGSVLQERINKTAVIEQMTDDRSASNPDQISKAWQTLAKINPFHRRLQDPPPEVSAHTVKPSPPPSSHGVSNIWDIRARLEDFAATQAEKFREKTRPNVDVEPLPLTIIPAPSRRRRNLEGISRNEERCGEVSSRIALDRSETPDEIEPLSQQSRTSDRYIPDALNQSSITRRGSVSFVTPMQQERRIGEGRLVSPREESHGDGSRPLSSLSGVDGLPIISVPAPPRRHRDDT